MKWIGAFLLISTSTWLGFDISKKFRDRTTQLRILLQSLQILEAEMSYSYSSLKQIFQNISRKIDPPVSTFYEQLAKRLSDVVFDFETVWEDELKLLVKRSALKPSDEEILSQFGRN